MPRNTTSRRAALCLIGVASLVLVTAACGEKESDTTGPSENASMPTVAVDQALADKVPAAIKADGTLFVGSDPSYAPSEFLDTDGKTVIGFDVDLFKAVAAKLGLKTKWEPASFASVIPGVQSGKYEVAVSALTINAERKQQVLMVSYFTAGTQWVAKKGASISPDNACGKKIAVQTGTVQVDDIVARNQKCATAGKPAITIDQYQAQSEATAAVVSGKNDGMLADSPISAYAVKKTGGQLTLIGDIYDSAPYGYVVNKDQQALAEALRDATAALIADGTYRSVLTRWGVDAGALSTTPTINP